jgi:hypothetical protein
MIGAWLAIGLAAASPRAELERLYTDGQHEQTITLGRRLLAEHPDDPELYWMVARAYFEVGELHSRDAASFDKDAWYIEMLRLSDAGLDRAPGHGHLLFAPGAALARLGTTRGLASSLFLADDIEAAWLAAAEDVSPYASLGREEVLPCDIYVCLGVFYRLVPDWWLVEALTGTRGSLDASLTWLQQAHSCSPDRINVVKELAVAEICAGQRGGDRDLSAAGLAHLEAASRLPVRTPVDALDQRHALMLLANPEGACACSRDGQIEHDRASITEKYMSN